MGRVPGKNYKADILVKATIVIPLLVHPPRFRGSHDPDFWVKADYAGFDAQRSIIAPGWIRFWRWGDATREIYKNVVL